jgi:hypothetical protein
MVSTGLKFIVAGSLCGKRFRFIENRRAKGGGGLSKGEEETFAYYNTFLSLI